MKKKYSNPLMFSSILLTGIEIGPSGEGTIGSGDDEWDNVRRSVFSVNSAMAVPASEEPVTIVNPVEEAVTSASTSATTSVEAGITGNDVGGITSSPLEIEPIIDEIVPEVTEEAATAGTVAN